MIAGDRSPLAFSVVLSVRSQFGSNRFLSLLTVIAIATSVSLGTGLEMSSRSVEADLARTADALAGAASLEVTGGELGIPEVLMEEVSSIDGVLAASPLIEATVRLADGQRAGEAVRLLGVDLLEDRKVRSYTMLSDTLEIQDPLRLLTDINSVILTKQLADRVGVTQGERLRVRSGRQEFDLIVRGLLGPGGVADAFEGQVAAMDVFALQNLLGRQGWIDRIDIAAGPGVDVDTLRSAVQLVVEGRATVRPSALRGVFVDRILGTVRLGVWVLTTIGILVAGFLSYGAMSLAVDRRIREFALLRSAGLEATRVRRFVLVDATILSVLGTAVGVGLGVLLSRSFISMFSGISEHLQQGEIQGLTIEESTVVVAVAVGLLVALIASVGPAKRATSHPPLDVLLQRESRLPVQRQLVILASVLMVVFSWASMLSLAPLRVPALVRLTLIFAVGLSALFVLSGPLFSFVLAPLRQLLEWIVPRVGGFVGGSLASRPRQTALTVASIAGITAGLAAVLVVLGTISHSIYDWIRDRYPGGLLIHASDPFSTVRADLLPHGVIREIRALEGVDSLLESFNSRILFDGEEVLLVVRSMEVLAEYGRLPVLNGNPRQVARQVYGGGVAVSAAFSRTFGLTVGDVLALDTPQGARVFPIVGLVRGFGGPSGEIHMDVGQFDQIWDRSGASGVVVWTSESADRLRDRLRMVSGDLPLFVTSTEEYARYGTRVVERFIAMLYMIAALIAFLAGLAVLNLLMGSVVERRKEFALLKAAGATSSNVGSLVLAEGTLVGLLAASAGVGLGVACSIPMCEVVAEELGWTLSLFIEWTQLAALAAAVVVASAMCGVYPSWATRAISPVAVAAPE